MLEEWRQEASDAALTAHVGPEVFRRALTVLNEGAVTAVDLSRDGRRVTATVRGTASQPYRTTMVLAGQGREGWTSVCTCPVAVECKHAVAALLALRSSAVGPTVQLPEWERTLTELVQGTEAPGRAPTRVPLGLQFEVSAEPAARASVGAPGSRPRLVRLRPVVPGKNGRWVRTGITWKQLQYDAAQSGWDRRHLAALRALYATHQASRGQYYSYAPTDVYLHEFGPGLWRMLDQALGDGVVLSGAGPRQQPVVLADAPADLAVDARQQAGGGAQLQAVVRVDGRAVDPAALSFLGHPAHGVTVHEPDPETALLLARLDRPATPTLAGLAARGRPLDVPAADVGRFLRDWYPDLRSRVPVVSGDGSVELPDVVPPRLAVTATYPGDLSVEIAWTVHYGPDRSFPPAAPGDTAQPGSGRDLDAERVLETRLPGPVGGVPELWTVDRRLTPAAELRGMEAMEFTSEVLPALREDAGVDLTVVGSPPDYRQSTAAPQITFTARDNTQSDWFDLGVAITVDGQVVPFSVLFQALVTGRTRLMLVTGTWFSLQRPEFDRLRQLIEEARALEDVPADGVVAVNRLQAGWWEELLTLGVLEEQSTRWTRDVQGLLDAGTGDRPEVPAGLTAQLRPYQHDGFAWLSFLWDRRIGGILADDMGLGKTLQTLALLARAHEAGDLDEAPVLVVAPTSVLSTWAREAARFAPGLQVAVVRETERRRGTPLAQHVAGAHVVVTSYAVFRLEDEQLQALPWRGLVLDEAQTVKNHQGRTYQCARRLDAPFTLALTGTPLENSVMDLWSLLSITAPGLFPDPSAFTHHYRTPIERDGDRERLASLRRRIKPLVLRRTKESVAPELPPKQEQVLEVTLNPEHEELYQKHLQRERQKVLGLVEDLAKNRFTIFQSLTLLRQLSLDPSLIDPDYASVASSKADAFVGHLTEVVEEGHRVLVFSQFTRFLGRIRDRLTAEGIEWAYLDGSTKDRDAVVDGFRQGDAPVFLISLKAGGSGLTITEADYVYVLDPWWNPATEAQAIDRTHRIGQTRNVMVYRLIARDTIEDKVMALNARKAKLFASVIDDGNTFGSTLTADDIRGLLA